VVAGDVVGMHSSVTGWGAGGAAGGSGSISDSAWAVGGFPGDPCALPVVDPSLRHSWRHSERYHSKSMSNKLHQHYKSHLTLHGERNVI
jgi:hypothetical protein